jgi:chromatin modification-related protein EAF6
MDASQPETPQKVAGQGTAESPAQAREAYTKAKQDLIDALARKRAIDKQLVSCEVQIYNFEATYLAETVGTGGGNIIQGFDGYLKNQGVNKRRTEVSDADRMFSNSSSTYAKVSRVSMST